MFLAVGAAAEYDWAAYWEGKPFSAAWRRSPARPMTAFGADVTKCPSPLEDACASKGVKAAHLEGPAQCGGRGMFCRIMPDPKYPTVGGSLGAFSDPNFWYCNGTRGTINEHEDIGHCHAVTADNMYKDWLQDHWFRPYHGTLHCCCNAYAAKGVVNRCDFSKPGRPEFGDDLRGCGRGYNPDPLYATSDQCWSVEYFGDWMGSPLASSQMPPVYPNNPQGDMPPKPPSPPPSPPPPPVIGYRVVHENKDCCRDNGKLKTVREVGQAASCATQCNSTAGCTHFSHSREWLDSNGGICTLCSECSEPTGSPGNGQYFKSWKKVGGASLPPPADGYTQIATRQDCCRYNGGKIRGFGRRKTPQRCFELCDEDSDCRYFSHSKRYFRGLCILCEACEFSGAPGNGRHYTSWAKPGGPAVSTRAFRLSNTTETRADMSAEFEEFEDPVDESSSSPGGASGDASLREWLQANIIGDDSDDDDAAAQQAANLGAFFGVGSAMLVLGLLAGGLTATYVLGRARPPMMVAVAPPKGQFDQNQC